MNQPFDTTDSTGALESQLVALEDRMRELDADAAPAEYALLQLEAGRALAGLGRNEQAWEAARPAFDVFLRGQDWEHAVEVCDILFQADQPGSLSALGQGLWLSVSFPVDAELTLTMLNHVIDDTPDESDGAAVAAATALYIVDLRAEGKQHDNLSFFANQMLGNVARRHSDVDSQEKFDFWFKKLELDDPEKFLVRLRNVVDVLVQDDWWFDREQVQQSIPVN